ncbi:NAD-dependent epimerase/dehydratase family protein [Modicisalibacter radicis]|uniref:NAD-dependent epimerase/dehydratase family protein n=1 Tax=Halomonas sp. EAR18 TaxID=2518972 RepID=UPI00144459ED|nr:NAD-dependent epimerase/dehydratase family protein [Halomonas sp. EAR18]
MLITGATGGLGKALVREALRRGHEVRAVGRSAPAGEALRALGAEFVVADLARPDADLAGLSEGADSVIHAAALSASWGPRRAFETNNVLVTERLLEAAAGSGVARFVFVSSPSIFATFGDRLSIGEHDSPASRPLNHYARTKSIAERRVLSPREDAMACCAIRPRALVGPGDRVILPSLVELAGRQRMPLPRGGRALIELTDLRDAAWSICEAEARAPGLAGRAINVSGGVPLAVEDIARRLTAALNVAPRLVPLPLRVAQGIAVSLEALAWLSRSRREPALTRYKLATLAYSQTFDLEPARRLLGYRPRYAALDTLLAEARQLASPRGTP